MPIRITGNVEVDAQLDSNPFALLTAMLLDQQVPMERAFVGPHTITTRMAEQGSGSFDPATVAAYDPDAFAALCSQKPAVHRFPGAMARRIQGLARHLEEEYDGDAARIWSDSGAAEAVLRRLRALPGYGEQKAQIFLALLGKQQGVRPGGWAEAVGGYGDQDAYRSVADVVDAESLAKVRAYKQETKAKKKHDG